MSSRFRFVVEVELERTEGKFAGRDEMAEQILSMLENANEGSIDGIGSDGMFNYEIVGWDDAQCHHHRHRGIERGELTHAR